LANPEYDEIGKFIDGLSRVKKDWKYGFINITGGEVAACIYDELSEFINGKAAFRRAGTSGYIDKTGSVLPG